MDVRVHGRERENEGSGIFFSGMGGGGSKPREGRPLFFSYKESMHSVFLSMYVRKCRQVRA